MLVQITFPGGASPSVLAALRAHGWTTLQAGHVAAKTATSLDAAQADFREATALDHGHVRWMSPHRVGKVPAAPPVKATPVVTRVVRRRLAVTPAR